MAVLKWLRRDCHTLALHYGLCLTEKDFKKELLRLGVREDVSFVKHEHSHATTHFMTSNKGLHIALITLRNDPKKTLEQVHSLLVHEGVHVWQEHCSLIGEKTPSHEFEAYAVQLIAQELMIAYKNMTKRKK